MRTYFDITIRTLIVGNSLNDLRIVINNGSCQIYRKIFDDAENIEFVWQPETKTGGDAERDVDTELCQVLEAVVTNLLDNREELSRIRRVERIREGKSA